MYIMISIKRAKENPTLAIIRAFDLLEWLAPALPMLRTPARRDITTAIKVVIIRVLKVNMGTSSYYL